MATWVDIVFFVYIFIGIYVISLFIFIYFPNRNRIFQYPHAKPEKVSIVVPCYNAEKNIAATIESLLNLNYPKGFIEIIVVDDKSTDRSVEIVKSYVKKYDNVRLIVSAKNSGGAAEPRNMGIRAAKFDYVAVTDDDSRPEKDALIKMLGFLQQDKRVAAVTCSVLSAKPKNFLQELQEIEYAVIALNRKVRDFVDSVYVTPGPFALYRKKILVEVGLFDPTNMTEDIEIVWRLMSRGYLARKSTDAGVKSETPSTFKAWWRQRLRWNIGGLQTIWRYKSFVFRKGMLGAFIIPYFAVTLFLGVFGLGLFVYLTSRRLLVSYLFTKYSLYASSTLLSLQDLSFAPSILNFFGIVLFLLGLIITFLVLNVMAQKGIRNRNVLKVLFYITIYLALYPLNLVHALYKVSVGKYSW